MLKIVNEPRKKVATMLEELPDDIPAIDVYETIKKLAPFVYNADDTFEGSEYLPMYYQFL